MKTKNILFTAMASIVFIANTQAQNVNVPDSNFKAALVGNASINTNMDAEIQLSEASVFNGAINVSQLNITDLTGIEAFVALDSLDCRGNHISGLELSANIALTYLDCSRNMEFPQIPNEPNPWGIDYVFVYYMDSLDVSANTSLTTLKCNNNGLLSLNVSGASALSYLDCSSNQRFVYNVNEGQGIPISTPIFNFLSNAALTTLICSSNGLASLDVSANTLLTYLDCNSNYNLLTLNLTGTSALTSLNCQSNQLTSLDFTGASALTYLNCEYNQLTSLDVSACSALTYLNCPFNQLTSLDVSSCVSLTYLNCKRNSITNLTLTGASALTSLLCGNNQLTSLDLTGTSMLNYLDCSNGCPFGGCFYNQLTNLDVSSCESLTYLNCDYDGITNLTLTGASALTFLNCSNNLFSSIDVSTNTALQDLFCYGTQISALDISANTALSILQCHGNQLTSLDVSTNTGLFWLVCADNHLTSLNLTGASALTYLHCGNNQLASINFSSNASLRALECMNNELLNLDLSLNPVLDIFHCENNHLASLNLKNGFNNNMNWQEHNWAQGNPDLNCVQVDDVIYSTINWSNDFPASSYFSENCSGVGISDNNLSTTLQVFLDGYYIYGSNPASMRAARYVNLTESGSSNTGAATDVDIITVELRSPSNLNVVVYSVSPILQTNGSVQCVFPAGALGASYYIVVKHRAAIPLWSANPVSISGSTTLNFSNNSTNAFTDGSVAPMKTLVSGLYATRLGELNGDGYLDGVDYSTFESNVYSSAYGGLYLLDGDLNGDSYVDASDFAVFDFNASLGSYEQRP